MVQNNQNTFVKLSLTLSLPALKKKRKRKKETYNLMCGCVAVNVLKRQIVTKSSRKATFFGHILGL